MAKKTKRVVGRSLSETIAQLAKHRVVQKMARRREREFKLQWDSAITVEENNLVYRN